MLIVDHGYGIETRYAHNSRFYVKPGEIVKRGQKVATTGNTGLSTGPHLHYEFRLNGVHKNPMRVKFPNAAPIPKKERPAFKAVA
ncbi:MAG: M23 family metallopeptidase, partial [Mycobacterium sp.]